MASPEYIQLLTSGVATWNSFRAANLKLKPDLSGADFVGASLVGVDLRRTKLDGVNLSGANLQGADLLGASIRGANLRRSDLSKADMREVSLQESDLQEAHLQGANLCEANLNGTNLCGAWLFGASLGEADLSGARLSGAWMSNAHLEEAYLRKTDLRRANLSGANLRWADMTGADLREANLSLAILVDANLQMADLTGCNVYGASTWDLKLSGAIQKNIIITHESAPMIQVDSLEVAQFIHLLLNNIEIRRVVDTITSTVVLILGRFTNERKTVLDAIRIALRRCGYLPVLFDWEKPSNRDVTETISTLAHMSKFVIADITDAKSIPQELMAIIPNLPSVPVQPLLLTSQTEYGMFEHFKRYPWVLPTVLYDDLHSLLCTLQERVIAPAESRLQEQRINAGKE